ncbi:MAG TPA: glycosyltransferase [Candidatus Polarisedimenticolaceae bacterium]|nr:glycosyltransferase [Candidatus Polarisedimenticolaceae bacterium]
MRLSIVIPSRNGAARLPETLASIGAQELDAPVDVLVVSDGSSDGTAEMAAGFSFPWGAPRVLAHARGQGRASACNSGLAGAAGEVIVVLDDDMTLLPGALRAHAAFHAAHPGTAMRARITLAPFPRDACFARFTAREEAEQEALLLRHREDVPFSLCLTGHFSAPKHVLEEVGGFDATISRYGFEDIELGYRLSRAGVRLRYEPAAASLHRAHAIDLSTYLERQGEAGAVARQLAERHPEGPFRAYLRVDPPRALGLGRDPAGLVALRLTNRMLLRAPVRRALGSGPGFAALLALLRAGEALHLDPLVHFGYHVARDVRYFQGYFGELG